MNGIVCRLIAAGFWNKKSLSFSVNSADDKGEEEVDLHVWVCAILGDDAWAYVKE